MIKYTRSRLQGQVLIMMGNKTIGTKEHTIYCLPIYENGEEIRKRTLIYFVINFNFFFSYCINMNIYDYKKGLKIK
jgi:hypothetical protein